MALLEIENLAVEFRYARGSFRAVDGVSLTVGSGERLAIVGESGSGKTVAMLAVMGLLPWNAVVTATRLTFAGHDLQALTHRQRRRLLGSELAMIFQEPVTSLNPCFTIGYQIGEAIAAHLGLSRPERRARAIALLQAVGIPEPERRLTAFPHQLSGGMCQRVMIALALACGPKLIIADEPTTALDVTIQAQILDLLVSVQRESGLALMLITHDMGVVAETAERVAVFYAGRKLEEQPVRDLFYDPRHPYTAALLAARPDCAAGKRLPSIPGAAPGAFERLSACAFAPRCAFATERCNTSLPPRHGSHFRQVLCHYPLIQGRPAGHPHANAR